MDREKMGSILAAAVLASSVWVLASDKAKGTPDKAEIRFRAGATLVVIPALVTNKSGAHVTGLKKEDFTVLENGAPRQIATSEEVTTNPQPWPGNANPNEFSNMSSGDGITRRMTLIVLDLLNTPFADQAYARAELLKYLAKSLDSREPTGLFTLTRSGIHIIHDFTSDPRVLMAAVRRVQGDVTKAADKEDSDTDLNAMSIPDLGAAQAEAQALGGMMREAELNLESYQQRVAIVVTLEGMQQLAQMLVGFPGRKALLWAGAGFPFSVSDATMQPAAGRESLDDVLAIYEQTWKMLNDAQIAVYPIDVKGLQAGVVPRSPSQIRRDAARNYNSNTNWRQIDTQATLQIFADASGGRAYFNSNDLVKGFNQAVQDSAQYYMLGYYLERSDTKAGWRKLSVRVNREHLEVRARSGFFVTRSTVNPATNRDNDVAAALHSPLDYTGLRMVVRWDAVQSSKEPGKKRVFYFVKLAPDPSLIDSTDNNHVMLEFFASAKTPQGWVTGLASGQKFDLHPAGEQLAVIRDKGIEYHGALELAAGEYSVRIVVRDNLSGRMGSVAAPLKVD